MDLPLEYQQGYTNFLDCHIDLSKRPLIPRVETEYWVKSFLGLDESSPYENADRPMRVLDIFAGSGCIGIAVLKHLPNTTVDFVDSEDNCVEQIKINCEINKIAKKRYRVIKGDVFEGWIPGQARDDTGYDLILANPPYCVEPNVDLSVLTYEPITAVIGGGSDGLDLVKRFLVEASRYLRPNGQIYMEFDDFQKEKIEELLSKLDYKSWEFHKDQFGLWRWLLLRFI